MKKVIIIDDSALMRRVLSDIIETDKRFILADVATNGLEAFDMITLDPKKYDVIILDINMPKMNGIQLLERMHALKIDIPVIIVSTIAREGTQETLRCLELGAFDFITKPESFMESKGEKFKTRVLDMIAAATGVAYGSGSPELRKKPVKPVPEKESPVKSVLRKVSETEERPVTTPLNPYVKSYSRKAHRSVSAGAKRVVALACSTGGPRALQSVIPFLPEKLNAPVVLVQHMPGGFTGTLAQRLNELSSISVKEAEDGDVLKKGHVYIAKGGTQLRVKKTGAEYVIRLSDEPARNGLKPCADIMYESLSELDFDEIVCAVLTGMGSDGTAGIAKLNENKNIYVISQDEATSTVYGMPRSVKEVGLSDEVQPLAKVADAITKIVGVQ